MNGTCYRSAYAFVVSLEKGQVTWDELNSFLRSPKAPFHNAGCSDGLTVQYLGIYPRWRTKRAPEYDSPEYEMALQLINRDRFIEWLAWAEVPHSLRLKITKAIRDRHLARLAVQAL